MIIMSAHFEPVSEKPQGKSVIKISIGQDLDLDLDLGLDSIHKPKREYHLSDFF